MAPPLRIGWMSHHVEGVAPLEALLRAGYPIAAIITLEPDLLAKRSGAAEFDAIAAEFGVPLRRIRNVNAPASLAVLEELALDALFVIGWSQILRADALKLVRIGCFGAHASMLPAYRGSAPINWALIRGETQTGNSLMLLSEAVDGGAIIAQRPIAITPFDNVDTLYARVAETNTAMLLDLAQKLCAGLPLDPTVQEPFDEASLMPRRRPEHGLINWDQPAAAVYNFIRAVTRPYPGAFSTLGAKRYLIWRSALLPVTGTLAAPGTILGPVVSDSPDACGIAVACADGAVLLLEIEAESEAPLAGPALASHDLRGAWDVGEDLL